MYSECILYREQTSTKPEHSYPGTLLHWYTLTPYTDALVRGTLCINIGAIVHDSAL